MANSTNAGNGEAGVALLIERINLIAATTVLGVTYGIMTNLYCMTAHFLLKKLLRRNPRTGSHPSSLDRSRSDWRKTFFYLVYTSALFVLATLYTAGNSHNAIVAYVDNRLYPGGPYQYYITFMTSQRIMVMTDITSLLILWMTDALILCRFIMFYYKVPYARWIIPLPCAMYFGVIALSTLVLQEEANLGKTFYLSENLLLAYYSLSFSLNVLATVLIAARLYWHKVQLERAFGSRMESPYMNIATLLIESAALYGAWSLVFLVLCVLQNPGLTIILATMSQIQVIAPLLIILRFARGKGWKCGKTYGEDDDEPRSNGVVRLSFSTRPTRMESRLGMDGAHPSTSRGSGAAVRESDEDVDGIELGKCGCQQSSLVHDVKVRTDV